MAIFDPWKTISGATCMNIFMTCGGNEIEEPIDLLIPLNCSLFIAIHWEDLIFSKTDRLEDLQPHVKSDVMQMKKILLENPESVKTQINNHINQCNGSLAFCLVVMNALYSNNEQVYDNDLRGLFQECWETMFWYVQALPKDSEMFQLINHFSDQHDSHYQKTIALINETNKV